MFKTKKLCVVSMFIALTVVLSYLSGFLRVGNISKISISFISVYLSAVAYGPVIGGFVGACADIVSYIVNPTGVFLWPLSIIEFFYGFLFGSLFYNDFKQKSKKNFNLMKIIICVIIRFLADLFLKTPVLINAGYLPESYCGAFLLRLPSVLLMAVIQLVILILINRFSKRLIELIRS